jgi:protein-disulfide isomerase
MWPYIPILDKGCAECRHKSAFKAAEAAHCAGEQGKYWEMHDQVFTNQQVLAQENWVGYAEALGLEMPKFRECLDSGKYAAAIRQDLKDGEEAQVRGTPTFFLGITEGDGNQVKVVRVIRGA